MTRLESARADPPLRPTSLRGIKVIIVEDNFTVAAGLEWMLQGCGCEVTGMAGTLEAALELIAQRTFDVAILDVDLKGRSVCPVAEQLRQRGDPFIFITGYGDPEVLPEALRAFPRLDKPVDLAQLAATILSIVARGPAA